jgi:hypothetical protein
MTHARSRVLPPGSVWVHAIHRCVRKAWLCGDGKDHRRQWVEDRLAEVARAFACEVAAYAVMSNHLHVVVRMRSDVTVSWSAAEVVARWCAVFGKSLPRMADGTIDPGLLRGFEQQSGWVAERRARLADLSWLMRAVAEDIARRANREDECTGRFWEGRFISVPLLDQVALVACMAYVDLNPVRARICDRPERSRHTAVRQRITARQRHRARGRLLTEAVSPAAGASAVAAAKLSAEVTPEAGCWVAPVTACTTGISSSAPVAERCWSLDDYLTLVDATGRLLCTGKRGHIPAELAPLLARLDVHLDQWLAAMRGWRSFIGRAVCAFRTRLARAQALGQQWIRNRCPLFAGEDRTVAA